MPSAPLYAFFGHHKCATTWIIGISTAVCERLELKFVNVPGADRFNFHLARFIAENQIDFFSYSNAVARYVAELNNFRGFHVVRDPRDIAVSAYFSHLHSHSPDDWTDLIAHRQYLQSVPQEEGLLRELERERQEFEDLYNWNYEQPNVLELKMEDIVRQPYDTMLRAFMFLGLTDDNRYFKTSTLIKEVANRLHQKSRGLFPFRFRPRKIHMLELMGILYHHRFSAKADGRKPGEENVKSHYRKGVAGDWVNHFTPVHRDYFKRHYNDVLLKLGYETSSDW